MLSDVWELLDAVIDMYLADAISGRDLSAAVREVLNGVEMVEFEVPDLPAYVSAFGLRCLSFTMTFNNPVERLVEAVLGRRGAAMQSEDYIRVLGAIDYQGYNSDVLARAACVLSDCEGVVKVFDAGATIANACYILIGGYAGVSVQEAMSVLEDMADYMKFAIDNGDSYCYQYSDAVCLEDWREARS